MKIALVRARYNAFGGAERFAARALTALAAETDGALDLAVIARAWQAEQGGQATRLVRCDPFYLGSVWRDAGFARAVHRQLRREHFDLVQSHERIPGLPLYRAGDGVHAAWLERRARAGGIATRIAIAFNPHHRYLAAAERAMFEHPALEAVICNSHMVRHEIAERFAIANDKLVLVRNGVDLERFHPAARDLHREPMRAALDVPPAARVLLLVGSGFERKGVRVALDAMRGLDDAVLVVVGSDKHARDYRDAATHVGVAGQVRFVGAVVDPLPYYAMADLFVLPTLYDPFPNAALEALACGLPLVTTEACGAAELVDQRFGRIVPVGDATALREAIGSLLALDATQWAAMREGARSAAEPLSLAALSGALLALYRRLLANR